jgi:hypothetical protein
MGFFVALLVHGMLAGSLYALLALVFNDTVGLRRATS